MSEAPTSSPTSSPADLSIEDDEPLLAPFAGFRNYNFGWSATETGISSFFLTYTSLLALCLLLSHALHASKGALKVYLPEAGLIVLVGIASGSMLSLLGSNPISTGLLSSFSSSTFFLLLLPPIIFNSGYHIKRDLFFPLLPAIGSYAVIGTSFSAFIVAIMLYLIPTGSFNPTFSELLAFGALISATDPVSTLAVFQQKSVSPTLFYLVFGESVINDAVGLVLYTTLSKFIGTSHSTETILVAILDFVIIFAGSTLLGLLTGLAGAYVFRRSDLSHNPLIELSLYALVIYTPFYVAEVLSMSGIVTILFTGITSKAYTHKSLSPQSSLAADSFFRLLAHLSETSIFLSLGLSVFGLSSTSDFHAPFIFYAIIACIISRIFHVYPLSFLLNSVVYRNSPSKISPSTQHMLAFSGLRGAVAYACSITFSDAFGNRDAFVVTTMAIVLFTVFVFGGLTEPAMSLLKIEQGVDEATFDPALIPNPGKSFVSRFAYSIHNKYLAPGLIKGEGALGSDSSGRGIAGIELASFNTLSSRSDESVEATSQNINSDRPIPQSEADTTRLNPVKARRMSSTSIFDFGQKRS